MVEFWSRNCLAVFFLIWAFHEFSQCSKPWLLDDYRGLYCPIGESIWTNQYNWQYHHQTSHPPGSPLGFPWAPRAWNVRSLSGGCGLVFGCDLDDGLVLFGKVSPETLFFSQEVWGFPVDVPEKKKQSNETWKILPTKKNDMQLKQHLIWSWLIIMGTTLHPPKSKTPVNYYNYVYIDLSVCCSIYQFYLSIYLSINQSNQSICLSAFLCLSISIYLYINLYLSFSICLFLSLPISIDFCLSLSISIYLYLYLSSSTYLYLYRFVSRSISISIYLYFYLYIFLSISIYPYLSLSLPIPISIYSYGCLIIYLSIDPLIYPSI